MSRHAQVRGGDTTVVCGHRLDNYLLLYRLASGGMGDVFLAQERGARGLERWVAVKVARTEVAERDRLVRMFLDEARIASQLAHPNLCSVLDFGEVSGCHYLVLEYLHGETLSALLRAMHGPGPRLTDRPLDVVARIVADAARGLHAAHEARGLDGTPLGVVHRDVSPQNIFVLYDGTTKVMDFGIALAKDRESKTRTGELKGKLGYMSPEQLTSQPVDRRTDVFALGVVLWEAVTGEPLFHAESAGATVANVLTKPIPSPSEMIRGFPAALDRVIGRAVERDLGLRYATAEEMADDLEAHLGRLHPASTATVAAVMRTAFAENIRMREAVLRRAPPDPDEADSDLDAALTMEVLATVERTSPRAPRAPERRGALRWILAAAAAAVVAAATVTWSSRQAERPATNGPAVDSSPRARSSTAPDLVATAPALRTALPLAGLDASLPEEDRATAAPEPPAVAPPAIAEPAPPPSLAPDPVRATPAPGFLNLLTRPTYAEVFLGRRRLGTTPLVRKSMPAGRQVLRLLPNGRGPPKAVVVQISSGRTTSLSVQLP